MKLPGHSRRQGDLGNQPAAPPVRPPAPHQIAFKYTSVLPEPVTPSSKNGRNSPRPDALGDCVIGRLLMHIQGMRFPGEEQAMPRSAPATISPNVFAPAPAHLDSPSAGSPPVPQHCAGPDAVPNTPAIPARASAASLPFASRTPRATAPLTRAMDREPRPLRPPPPDPSSTNPRKTTAPPLTFCDKYAADKDFVSSMRRIASADRFAPPHQQQLPSRVPPPMSSIIRLAAAHIVRQRRH